MRMYRSTILIGLAFGALAAAFQDVARAIASTVKGSALYRSLTSFECQSVGMTRLKLTLAQWRDSAADHLAVMRSDMRAQGHGAVFNSVPVPTSMRMAC